MGSRNGAHSICTIDFAFEPYLSEYPTNSNAHLFTCKPGRREEWTDAKIEAKVFILRRQVSVRGRLFVSVNKFDSNSSSVLGFSKPAVRRLFTKSPTLISWTWTKSPLRGKGIVLIQYYCLVGIYCLSENFTSNELQLSSNKLVLLKLGSYRNQFINLHSPKALRQQIMIKMGQ